MRLVLAICVVIVLLVPATAASPPSASTGPLAGVRVNIDPGHNGENRSHPREINRQVDAGPLNKACDTTGAATASGMTESSFNLAVALTLRDELVKRGAVVSMTRSDDRGWGPCIDKRARIGNKAQVAISIHADGNLGKGNRGFHVIQPKSMKGYTDDIATESADLARLVRAGMDRTGIPRSNYIGANGLSTRGDLGGLNLSNVPKVFVESGNLRNPADARALKRTKMRQRIAVVLADALEQYARRADLKGSGS